MSSTEIEIAKSAWAEGHRRLEDTKSDRTRHDRLVAQVDAVLAELRKRIGGTFTTAELVRAYGGAERWSRDAVGTVVESQSQLADLALVEDAAFHLYARGASDYTP